MRANGPDGRCKYEGTCAGREAASEREAFRRRLRTFGLTLFATESAGVSKSLSIPDGYALGNSGDSGQNIIEALSNDRLMCLDSESIVR